MDYRVGLIQFKPEFLQMEENLQKIEELIRKNEADLIVLPELVVSGYVFKNKEEVQSVSEDARDGATATLMRKLSGEMNVSIVIGFAEKHHDNIYNSALLTNPDGTFFTYRKTHLFAEEKLYFTPGDTGFQVYNAKNNVRVGIMICFDWQFPESARSLSLKGAQIICHPSNLVLPWCQQAMIIRSLENRVYSITANRIGLERNGDKELFFTGMSQILGTKGEILHRMKMDEEEVQVITINPYLADNKKVTEYNSVFSDRRPDLYELD
ncbi:MAG: beta-ureidopropionase [Candidatus Cloacimonetes bacterium]|nr:beta-ureidopropionase [Candidatus Cloacimonadota bacterium]